MDNKEAKKYWNKYHTNPYCECGSIMILDINRKWVCQDHKEANHKTHRLSTNNNRTMCGRTNVQYLAMASWEGVDCKECLKHINKKAFEWKEE